MNLSKIVCINDSYPIGFVKEGKKFKIDQGSIVEIIFDLDQRYILKRDVISIDGLDHSTKDFMVFEDWRNEKIDKIIND